MDWKLARPEQGRRVPCSVGNQQQLRKPAHNYLLTERGGTPGHTEDLRDLTRGNGFELEPLPEAVKSKSDFI